MFCISFWNSSVLWTAQPPIQVKMFKLLICAIFAAAIALPIEHKEHHIDYHAHPKYSFEYKIEDPHTHDMKSQWEKRDGDKVVGQYRIAEPDGTIRVVDYTADGHNGFNAVVRREGEAHHPETIISRIGYRLGQQEFGGEINQIEETEFRGGYGYGGHIGGVYGEEGRIREQIGY